MATRKFTNELGNHISINVSTVDTGGVEGVRMHIEGPASEIESIVTLKEARVLHEELGRVLGIGESRVD
jgi:hypothetical protein